MYPSEVMKIIPLWLLFIIGAAIVLLSIEVGWRVGNYTWKRTHDEKKKTSVSPVVGATLGLLAFLLAFTFNMAATRYTNLKQMVVQEANAIGTVYQRADFLPQQPRDEVRALLREYTTLHAGGQSAVLSPQGLAESGSVEGRLWAIAVDLEAKSSSSPLLYFIQSLNTMYDTDAQRISLWRNGIPDSIWFMLGMAMILTMAALGYELGLTGSRSWPVVLLLVLVFTMVIMLTADLDQPQTGFVQVSQQPLIDLINRMGASVP